MEKRQLFPQIRGLMHGGDYNPEQWLDRPDILEEDIRLMKKAGMNCATLGVFSWSAYEPVEGEYHFEWLKERMDTLYENGIYTVLATPSGARPAWLDQKYPEAMRVDSYGVRAHHGVRHNHCMSSPVYREKVQQILGKIVEQVGNHPGLIMWHISNEFGGECYCPLCVERFRKYLSDKFEGDIGKLNHAWWTAFWSHTYQDFSQIEPPYQNGEYSIMGLNLEWKRFTTWNMTDYMKSEIAFLKNKTPNVPITTNFMQLYQGLDYRVMAKELDVISWDSYPRFHNDEESLGETLSRNAFDHAIMRSMKRDQPFMLMESAPGLVNWQPYNKMKRPGVHRLASLQAVACGSDTVQYFQWRKGRGSFEQYHGAVVDHIGTDDTRIFREVAELGKELEKLGDVRGTTVQARTAMILDWDTMWAIEDMKGLADETKKYEETCVEIFRSFLALGVEMDVISSEDSLDRYDVVVAPMLYMLKGDVAGRLKEFVNRGGQLLATYLTGYVDEGTLNFLGGFPGNGLKDLFGVISEEIDTLYPGDKNRAVFSDGTTAEIREYAEVLRVSDAQILATYEQDYYAGKAVVTMRKQGNGAAYYVAARMDSSKMQELFCRMLTAAGISWKKMPEAIQCYRRSAEGEQYTFYLNVSEEEQVFTGVSGYDLLTDRKIEGDVCMKKYDVVIVKEQEEI